MFYIGHASRALSDDEKCRVGRREYCKLCMCSYYRYSKHRSQILSSEDLAKYIPETLETGKVSAYGMSRSS